MRKMNMKKYFLNKNSQPVTNISSVPADSGLHNKSLFNPLNGANQQVEVFKGLKLRDFEGLILKKMWILATYKRGFEMLKKKGKH